MDEKRKQNFDPFFVFDLQVILISKLCMFRVTHRPSCTLLPNDAEVNSEGYMLVQCYCFVILLHYRPQHQTQFGRSLNPEFITSLQLPHLHICEIGFLAVSSGSMCWPYEPLCAMKLNSSCVGSTTSGLCIRQWTARQSNTPNTTMVM